ncbi:hypothetical protein LTR50_006000 [Elasticomyces elasticus]|nr:hypothetical protein LTR50_006000 [Elasticomyces elasticus]
MASSRPVSVTPKHDQSASLPSSTYLTPDSDSEDDDYARRSRSGAASYRMKNLKRTTEDDGAESCERSGSERSHEDEEDEGDATAGAQRHRTRAESTQSFELYTPDEEKAVLRKLDRRLVLFMALLYMLSFLDRSNIGNAKLAGMKDELRLSSAQYDWLLTAFYVTYILFEWMALLYRVFPPHVYIAVCVFAWGFLASLQSIASSFESLFALRALLGVSEAAFGPGVPYYLSFFFRRDELAFRVGLFISAAPLATSFASSLAWAIVKLGQRWDAISGWRLLFLIEGFPSVLVAVWAWRWVPDSPAEARWLNARERRVAALRLRRDREESRDLGEKGGVSRHTVKKRFQWKEIGKTLLDPKSYLTAMMFFSCNVAFSSMPVFLPTIINEMGYSTVASQALSAPPYLVAFAVVLFTAYISDKYRTRSIPIAIHASLALLGYTGLALTPALHLSNAVRYLCIFPITAGFFSAVTVVIVWTINNQQSDEGKGTGIAMLNIIGQCGPLVGTRLYPDSDAPYFVPGMTVCAVFMAMVGVLALGLRFVLERGNKKKLEERLGVQGDGASVELLVSRQAARERHAFVYIL